MEKKLKVGVLGATGMVGSVLLLFWRITPGMR